MCLEDIKIEVFTSHPVVRAHVEEEVDGVSTAESQSKSVKVLKVKEFTVHAIAHALL